MSVKAIQILSDSSKNIVTEKGTRSSYDKVIFNSSPSIEIKKRHTCSSTQGESRPMFHTTSFPTSLSSSPTSSYTLPEHSYSAPALHINPQRSIVDSTPDINLSDSKSQFDQQHDGDDGNTTETSTERKFLPSDLPKIATHFVQEPTVSSEFLKKGPQHQRVASDDSLASLTALPSPATSVNDFPAVHHVKHAPPSLNADIKNYPHHLSHFEGHLQNDHKEDHHTHHTGDDNGPIFEHHSLQQRLSKFGLTQDTELIGHYAILKTIGAGAFSEVKLSIDLNGCKKVAVKMIAMKGIEDSERLKASVLREVEILKYIDHPNIVRLLDTVEISTHLCLVLEYIPGGELFDYVNDYFEESNEEESKRIFLQLVNILEYLHENNIVHRDLKLENILIDSFNPLVIKLTDFGLAKFIDKSSPILTTRCGSEEYAAPELISGKPYDGRKTDLWSLGIILYALLVGYLPFNLEPGQLRRQFFSKIIRADFTFPNSEKETGRKSTISNEAKDLVKKILQNNPQKRLSLAGIKNHAWLKSVII
ncbi:kinase-like domain-containing protein [Glomus cerebriforme]|uniref:Kinase-like domain-containing protein n=1 Tax=Glomus cerebriforme TaxID=658196 RepID=A0A397T5M4_9GLOM|nr:kinase-like domain-containing protein [Glomus cerebriforme]